jgi:hypothetical protein
MRILLIVLLSIVVVASSLLGLAFSGSLTFGPANEKLRKAVTTLEEAKALPKGLTEEIAGKKQGDLLAVMERAIRAYRVTQVGGVAIAGLNIALLVLAIRRRARGTAIAAVLAVAVGAVCFVLTPPKDLGDEAIYFANSFLAISTVLASLLALIASRIGRAARVSVPARAPA